MRNPHSTTTTTMMETITMSNLHNYDVQLFPNTFTAESPEDAVRQAIEELLMNGVDGMYSYENLDTGETGAIHSEELY